MSSLVKEIYNQPKCILPKSFFEGRFPPNVHPDSLDYKQWWSEQIRRAKEGWSDGGFTVPGVYYHHLNFKKINMLDKQNKPFIGNPYFSLDDMDLFKEMIAAREAGQGFLLITGRGFGKSYDISTFVEHEFMYYPASESIISASTDFFAKELWFKVVLGINSVPDELRPNLLSNTKDYIESGLKYKNPETGKEKTIGFRSKIHRIVYDNDAGKTRGTRPNIHVFEEGGSWSGAAKLLDCYNQTEASWWRGSVYTSFPVIIGTGGQMKQGGSEDFKIMFENPEAFNLRAFDYNGVKQGKFIPAYTKFGGFYEKTGISDSKGAKEFLDKRREKKKKNGKTYQQEIQEFPYEPQEAFTISGYTAFDVNKIFTRYAEIQKSPELLNIPEKCDLRFIRSGSKIIGVEKVLDKNGPFEIIEHPVLSDGKPIRNLYVSGCDSFDAVEEESDENNIKSKGSIFMFKRFRNINETGRIYVAKLTQRTNNASKFYWNTVKLNMYYGSKMLYEHTKIGIAQHYITNRLSHLLYPRPKLDQVTFKKSQSTNVYGITMPIQVKHHMIGKYSEYIDEYIDQMYFHSQLLDAMNFRYGSSKFDETMAAALALLADDDMYDMQVKENIKNNKQFPKFIRNSRGELIYD